MCAVLETGDIAGPSILTAQGAGQRQNAVTDIRVQHAQFLVNLVEQQVIQKTVDITSFFVGSITT